MLSKELMCKALALAKGYYAAIDIQPSQHPHPSHIENFLAKSRKHFALDQD